MNLIMLGPPGAGKGTQATRLAQQRGVPKISTGDILREAVHAGTDVGRRAKVAMDRGELVSDELMIGIVKERLSRHDALGGFVLDGFPRTVAQAAALDTMMTGRDPLIVLDIVVPEAELVKRLGSRMICRDCGADVVPSADAGAPGSGKDVSPAASAGEPRCRRCGGPIVQRADDNLDIVRERLKVYLRETSPLVEYYRERPTFRSIDGLQSAERVAADIVAAIEAAGHPTVGIGGQR
ncbi:MAG: adenylate kinase [Acidobacteria bacterium]|nr:adenylate kinase [Acidobacteriota bacterium]